MHEGVTLYAPHIGEPRILRSISFLNLRGRRERMFEFWQTKHKNIQNPIRRVGIEPWTRRLFVKFTNINTTKQPLFEAVAVQN
jgi:hypothetical protein